MADLPTPEQIAASNDILKTIFAANPILGTIIASLGTLGVVFSWVKGKLTKKNTEATIANTQMLAAHKQDMQILKMEATNTINSAVKEFKQSVEQSKNELMAEINNVKIVVVKVNQAADQKLGMIPRVQDAIEKEKARVDEILTVITKGKIK